MTASVGDITRVIAIPIGAATDGTVVFHSVALTCLELWVGEKHDHSATATRTWPTASTTSKLRALIGADDCAVRLEDLNGIASLCIDFQRRLGADILCGITGAAACTNGSAASNSELIVVAVKTFFRLAGTIGDVEAAIDDHCAVRVGAIVGITVGVVDASVDSEVLGRIHSVVFHGISLDVAAVDGQRGLAFDALTAFVLRLGAVYGDVAAVDGQVALCLDAFGVGIVAATPWTTATARNGDTLAAGC